MSIRFVALDSETVRRLQDGGVDAYGNTPVRLVSDGGAIPCRHCLQRVAKGEPYLALAYSPFVERQPYAETGPIFLHAERCERAADSATPAAMFKSGGQYILRGYDTSDWIKYDAAEIVPANQLVQRAEELLSRGDVAYVHMRSSRYNCYQCRIERV